MKWRIDFDKPSESKFGFFAENVRAPNQCTDALGATRHADGSGAGLSDGRGDGLYTSRGSGYGIRRGSGNIGGQGNG